MAAIATLLRGIKLRFNLKRFQRAIPLVSCTFRNRYFSASSSNDILMRSISEDSRKKINHLTFGEMFKHTKFAHQDKNLSSTTIDPHQFLVHSAEFSRKEHFTRIAKLILCLKNLPYGVTDTQSISSIIDGYITTYEVIRQTKKIETMDDVTEHYELTKSILLKHLLAIPKISYGLLQKATEGNSIFSIEKCPYLNDFIDEFSQERIAIRVLIGHFITMYDQINSKEFKQIKRVTGLFEENCDIIKYVEQAIDDTIACGNRHWNNYVTLPEMKIHDKRRNVNATFTYLPEHLHHMIFELLKNSTRASVEFNQKNNPDSDVPPEAIDIVIVNDNNGSIAIKISDIGGGISRDNIQKIWLYSYTTAYDIDIKGDDNSDTTAEQKKLIKQRDLYDVTLQTTEKALDTIAVDREILGAIKYTPMFGLGYGLPICKLYAEYFGGSCKIQSIDGYGTDAYLYLNNLTDSNVRVI